MSEMKRLLIVEDSPTIIALMRTMLKEMNVKIQTAGSEFGMFQAIESFGKTVDLIIMDITLKSENGLDLISKMRENPNYVDIPVVVVSEHAILDFIVRAKELNVKSFIRKPLVKEIFIERLVDAIGIEPLPLRTPANIEPAPSVLSTGEAPLSNETEAQSPESASETGTEPEVSDENEITEDVQAEIENSNSDSE